MLISDVDTTKPEVAVSVIGVSKYFAPSKGQGTMKQAFTSFFKFNKDTVKQEGYWALKDVSFSVKKGEFFGIVGKNGSGKSTLLKMIAGVYLPTNGAISVNGKLIPFIELGVGFNPELSGKDNVYLNGALLGFNRKEMHDMYKEIVEFAELEEHMDVKLKNYSSGMQVRLAFSIAIRAKGDILLLDEVLAVGDAAFQKKCYDYFRFLKKEKKTVVFISHDMNAVREYCDRAILIKDGIIISNGSSNRVATDYIKIFHETESKSTHISDKRWGNGKIKIKSIVADVEDEHISVSVTYDINEDCTNPVFGLAVFSPIGTKIFESNTKWKRIKTGTFKAGSSPSTVWKLPNIFTNGTNTITLAVANEDVSEFYDWWDEAYNLRIDKDAVTSAVTLPEFNVRVSK